MSEEKSITETYLINCPKCNVNPKIKQTFSVCKFSQKKGLVLRCKECDKLIIRKVDTLRRVKWGKKMKKYTKKQIDFLRQQYSHTSVTREGLVEQFNKKFNENVGKSTLGFVLSKHKILKDKKFHKGLSTFYDEEKLKFLIQNYKSTDITREELTQMFNEKFKLDKSVSAIIHTLKRHKILKDDEYREAVNKKYQRKAISAYTEVHINFIKKNYTENTDMTRKKLLKLFNEWFGLDISIFQLCYIINRYKLGRSSVGRSPIYNYEVKQFIKKCIEEGLTKQECKEACEKEFERHFNIQSMGQATNKMGMIFRNPFQIGINKFFEERVEIEEMIRKLVKKNFKSTYHNILIRDMIIEKYEKNIKSIDICNFCEIKKIKINVHGKTKEEKSERSRERYKTRKKRRIVTERLNDDYNDYI